MPPQSSGLWKPLLRLHHGGQGEVWLTHHESDPTDIAVVKVLHTQVWGEEKQRSAWARREREAAERLQHSRSPRLLDHGEDEKSQPYLVFEYFPGRNLHRLLQQGPLSAAEARRMAAQLLPALVEAHRLGINHRDIKPSNILFAPQGWVLVDWGLASGADLTQVTRLGEPPGTLAYIPPEEFLQEEGPGPLGSRDI
jgi:serine/threonine protein kinase